MHERKPVFWRADHRLRKITLITCISMNLVCFAMNNVKILTYQSFCNPKVGKVTIFRNCILSKWRDSKNHRRVVTTPTSFGHQVLLAGESRKRDGHFIHQVPLHETPFQQTKQKDSLAGLPKEAARCDRAMRQRQENGNLSPIAIRNNQKP